jgi:hypothetical protein
MSSNNNNNNNHNSGVGRGFKSSHPVHFLLWETTALNSARFWEDVGQIQQQCSY